MFESRRHRSINESSICAAVVKPYHRVYRHPPGLFSVGRGHLSIWAGPPPAYHSLLLNIRAPPPAQLDCRLCPYPPPLPGRRGSSLFCPHNPCLDSLPGVLIGAHHSSRFDTCAGTGVRSHFPGCATVDIWPRFRFSAL